MITLSEQAAAVAERLKARKDTVAVAESSTGGLVSANLLAVPGASAYFLGGTIIYTLRARRELLGIDKVTLDRQQPLTEAYVTLCAERIRARLDATKGFRFEKGASASTRC